MESFKRNGSDGTQRLFLSLIVSAYLLAGGWGLVAKQMHFFQEALVGGLLVLLTMILSWIAASRARRTGDNHIRFPILVLALLVFSLLINRFFLSA